LSLIVFHASFMEVNYEWQKPICRPFFAELCDAAPQVHLRHLDICQNALNNLTLALYFPFAL
jgi:hypothetical protein